MTEQIILFDSGHGKETPGKRSPKFDGRQLFEYEFNRNIVARIRTGLYKLDIQSIDLVPEETDVPLNERWRRANRYLKLNPILISVHANAFGDGNSFNSANGWEAFTSKGLSEADYLCNFLYEAAKEVLGSEFKMREGGIYPNLAGKEAEFAMVKYAKCPSVLTENLFMTNRKECEFIMSDIGRQAIAELHIKGIHDYVKQT